MTRDRRGLTALVACLAVLALPAATALAERPATAAEFAAIDRSFYRRRSVRCTSGLEWVQVSTRGPFAGLAYLRGGQDWNLVRAARLRDALVGASRRSPMRVSAAAWYRRP